MYFRGRCPLLVGEGLGEATAEGGEMFCRALTVASLALAVAALAVPVSQAQLAQLTQEGTQTTQTKMIPYYPRLGLRVDKTLYAGQRTFYRPDDRGVAAGIGNTETTSSSAQLTRLPWEGGGTQAAQTAVRPDDRGEVAGIGIAPVTPQATSTSSSSTDWTTLFVAVVAGMALVLLIGGGVAVTRRHGENVAV
jgi:hypothetical protein